MREGSHLASKAYNTNIQKVVEATFLTNQDHKPDLQRQEAGYTKDQQQKFFSTTPEH